MISVYVCCYVQRLYRFKLMLLLHAKVAQSLVDGATICNGFKNVA